LSQAKGVLPRDEDREILYRNPRTCGYFVGVHLDSAMDRPRAVAWVTRVSALVDELVARRAERGEPAENGEDGEKVAAVAVGFAPRFFTLAGIDAPASFRPGAELPSEIPALAAVPPVTADAMFYVASVFEARVNTFVSSLATMRPDVTGITIDRGYQRLDDTEPFGYLDGVRNVVPRTARPGVVFVHRGEHHWDEPRWADGGTYMAFLRILQRPDQFAALGDDDSARDAVIGRRRDGSRLDLPAASTPGHGEGEPGPELPPASHVRKAGPRGAHDEVQIFRRGLPFIEADSAGQVRVGLNFCSFQASLAQFNVVFGDWMMNPRFPNVAEGGDAGVDALLDPARNITAIEKAGFFFVPPYDEGGLTGPLFSQGQSKKPTTGRLVVHKRIVQAGDPSRRFERRGFRFRIQGDDGTPLPDSEFETDGMGRALCPVPLTIGAQYRLEELGSALVPAVQLAAPLAFQMDSPNKQLHVVNHVTDSAAPYGAA
jgi:Dyp-type peroxidase family